MACDVWNQGFHYWTFVNYEVWGEKTPLSMRLQHDSAMTHTKTRNDCQFFSQIMTLILSVAFVWTRYLCFILVALAENLCWNWWIKIHVKVNSGQRMTVSAHKYSAFPWFHSLMFPKPTVKEVLSQKGGAEWSNQQVHIKVYSKTNRGKGVKVSRIKWFNLFITLISKLGRN